MFDDTGCILNLFVCAMREAFASDSIQPPDGGGSSEVRVFAGDAIPLSAWDAHAEGCGCGEPFLWVRLTRRYRSAQFPTPYVGPSPCGTPVVLAVEVGVGRCAVVGAQPSWDDYDREAEVSLDDSWRIELALCTAVKRVGKNGCGTQGAVDNVVPYGPEGGVIAWLGTAYVQI